MRKFVLIWILTLSLSYPTFSQFAEVDWGTAINKEATESFNNILGETSDAFFVEKHIKTGLLSFDVAIEKYNKETFEKEFSTVVYNSQMYADKKKTRVMDVNDVLMLDNKILMFVSEYDRASDTYTSYAQKMNLDGLLDGTLIKLDEYKTPEKSLRGKYEFVKSPDNKNIVLYHKRPFKMYNDEKFKIKKFDQDLNLIWEKDLAFPYKDKDFNLFSLKVMNDGNCYILARIFLDNEEAREKKNNLEATYYFKLLSFSDTDTIQESFFKETNIELPKRWITDISFTTINDEIVCAGFYADKKDMAVTGTFFMRIEKTTGLIRAQDTEEFSKTFLAEFIGDKKAERGNGLRDFVLSDIIRRNDGGLMLVGEQFFIKTVCYTSSGNTRCNDYYYYNDIIVVNINSKGEIEWNARVPKRSMDSQNGFYLSYALAVKGNQVYFIYNENQKNLTITDPRMLKNVNISSSVAVLAHINSKGDVSREVLFTSKESQAYLRPKTCKQLNPNQMIILGVKGKNTQWGKLRFP